MRAPREIVCFVNRLAAAAGTGVHCAEVRHTEHRMWVRLVGRRHDLQLWAPDDGPGP